MISYDTAKDLRDELEPDYQQRHEDHKALRRYWHGGYWDHVDSEASGIAAAFRDLTTKRSDVGPDLKLVRNVLFEVCVKYQTFLSPLPMIRVYVDPPETENRKRQATVKERYLYGTWNQRPLSMKEVLNRAAWYLPLMGDCFLGAFPDLDGKIIRPVLRSPEYAYPIQSYDGTTLDAVIFSWEATEARVARDFPNYVRKADTHGGRFRFLSGRRRKPEASPKVEMLEYSDGKEFSRWGGEQKLNGVEHEFGFNLFDQLSFIHVPDEPWNHGAVEQAVGMVEMGNALYSLLFQAVLENVFPTLFLINPHKAPEQLDLGPGGVVGINEGGDVKWLTPPVQALGAQLQMLAENERAIKQDTSMPDVNFGQFNASIVTGKAINELQGAGTGSTVEMVQGVGIGSGMVSFNEKALNLGKVMFREEQMDLSGFATGGMTDVNPKPFTLKVKGKEIVGSVRNEVVFSPHLGLHEKIVMMLQAKEAGLVGKEYARNQIGIPDSQAMDEEIYSEQIEEIGRAHV